MMSESTCAACRFWERKSEAVNGHPGIGICHRNPPAVFPVPQVNQITGQVEGMAGQNFWPPTLGNEWCGEHQPALELVTQA